MQIGKNNNNRFRKLIPTNNRHINPTTAQIYSAQFKVHSGSQPKIETLHSNSHKSNFHSLQRQSGEDLRSLRQRQIVERRLRTISAAAFEGQKQTTEFNDHNLKRKNQKPIMEDQIKIGKKNKLAQLLDLIVQFQLKTDSILKYQEQEIPNKTQTLKEEEIDEKIFQEQVYQLIRKTRESSINLMAIYINRILKQIKQDTLNCLNEYEEQIQEQNSYEQINHQSDNSYLVSDIDMVFEKGETKDRRNPRGRGNLLDVNKFFDRN